MWFLSLTAQARYEGTTVERQVGEGGAASGRRWGGKWVFGTFSVGLGSSGRVGLKNGHFRFLSEGFPTISDDFRGVPEDVPKISRAVPMTFRGISEGFPRGFRRLSDDFPRASRRVPDDVPRVSEGGHTLYLCK